MRRREFITLFAAAAAASPLVARAQKPTKIPHVVIISPARLPTDRYQEQLRDLGYIEGRNIHIEFRDAGGYADRLPMLAEQLVQAGGVEVIATISLPATIAAFKATHTIPIVGFVAGDPVASGLARSLAHPDGNVTGVAVFAEETNVKRVELMREVAPSAVRLAMIATQIGLTQQSLASTREAARKLGFVLEVVSLDDPNDIAKSLSPERLAGFDAFVVPPDAVLSSRMVEVIKPVGLSNKPAIYPDPAWAANGGLMSFGPDFAEAGRRWVSQLDRVLKGEKPGDLPFDRPTEFYLSINLRAAREMGVELPPAMLARADKVIE
jgi:putative tryptophan/tyrosine transport system substrate-binding protein